MQLERFLPKCLSASSRGKRPCVLPNRLSSPFSSSSFCAWSPRRTLQNMCEDMQQGRRSQRLFLERDSPQHARRAVDPRGQQRHRFFRKHRPPQIFRREMKRAFLGEENSHKRIRSTSEKDSSAGSPPLSSSPDTISSASAAVSCEKSCARCIQEEKKWHCAQCEDGYFLTTKGACIWKTPTINSGAFFFACGHRELSRCRARGIEIQQPQYHA